MAKKQLKYVGPHAAGVEVPTVGLVKPGEPFEVDAELAEQLVAQGFKPARKRAASSGGGSS